MIKIEIDRNLFKKISKRLNGVFFFSHDCSEDRTIIRVDLGNLLLDQYPGEPFIGFEKLVRFTKKGKLFSDSFVRCRELE